MKLLLATYEYPPDMGGVAEYLGGLFGSMPDVHAVKFDLPKRPLGWLWHLPKLWSEARTFKPDVIVVSHLLPLGTAAMLIGRPYAAIVHGLDLRFALHKKTLASRVLKGAKLLVANSQSTAGELSGFGIDPASALVLTPCPSAELETMGDNAARAKFELTDKKVLLSVGRLVSRKGFDRLIRLLPELRKACGEVVLVIAGAGPEEGRLRREATLSGVEPHIRFVIAPDQATLASLYRAADVFALAVRASKDDVEGFGIVFLEAALFGLPTVGTRTGGVPEAVQDGVTGLLADPDSDGELYEHIKRLLEHPEEAKHLGTAGRERVVHDFRWEDRRAQLLKRLA